MLKNAGDLLLGIQQEIRNVNTEQLKKLITNQPDLLLIDVRTEREIDNIGTIGIGQNVVIPRGWLEFRINEYTDENTPIVVYSELNMRSIFAAKTLQNMGYKNVMSYKDGYITWRDKGEVIKLTDNAPDSSLFDYPKKVVDGVYSAIGATTQASYQNSGHNNNLSFIIGSKSVLVFNAGGNYLLAKALHQEIKKITDKPVKYVVLENAQGHAILGSNYWKEQGANIIAHQLVVDIIKNNKQQLLARNQHLLKDKFHGTKVILPDQTFKDKLVLDLGNLKIELLYLGASHSPESISLWLPSQALFISGDFAFNTRMLPIFRHTDTKNWLTVWQKLLDLKPKIIIPGHGGVTDIKTVSEFTVNYLRYLRGEIEKILDNDGDLVDVYKIDQSHFKHWDTYQELHRQNASYLYQQMEFE